MKTTVKKPLVGITVTYRLGSHEKTAQIRGDFDTIMIEDIAETLKLPAENIVAFGKVVVVMNSALRIYAALLVVVLMFLTLVLIEKSHELKKEMKVSNYASKIYYCVKENR